MYSGKMAYITCFKELREKYPSWTQLSEFLQSAEGGEFTIRESSPYAVIRYNREKSALTKEQSWMRSFVWNMETHLPACVGPSKSRPLDEFPLRTPLTIQEFLDGVMINMFIEKTNPTEVHMSSRSYLGATGNFYSKKSFGELAKEALQRTFGSLNPFAECDVPILTQMSTFASFVLSHPEHRVVAKTYSPRITGVLYGNVIQDGTVQIFHYYPHAHQNHTLQKNFCVTFGIQDFLSQEQLQNLIREEAQKRGWTWQGFVFKDSAGNRYKLQNSTYQYLRNLRGNESNAIQRFVRLRGEGKVKEYLKHYSEDSKVFWDLEQKLRQRTQEIYDAYVSVHKSHEKKFADIKQPDKTVVFKLHAHFLSDLREKNESVQRKHVIELVNSLPLWEQALLLRDTVVEQPSNA